MGLTFLMDTAYLLPLTIFFIAVSVGALGFRAERRRGYGPFLVGTVAGMLLLVGKFALDCTVAVYASLPLLIGASFWNAWPVRLTAGVRTAPAETLIQLGSTGDSTMTTKRKIEVFSAGCPACDETVKMVQTIACPSCEVNVLDMHDPKVASRAKGLGIRSVPAVVIDGKLANCCTGRGPEEATLRAAGVGQAI